MAYERGYRIYEPIDPLAPNPKNDTLVKEFIEGIDFFVSDISKAWLENLTTSTFLNAGKTEYRYVAVFDDENIGSVSQVVSLLNLVPPENFTASPQEGDKILVNLTNVDGATGYKYRLTNLTNFIESSNTLATDHTIGSLSASTTYRLFIASIGENNVTTEWSTTYYDITTWKPFVFNPPIVASKYVKWSWQYTVDSKTNRFELIDADTLEVIYSGLNNFYEMSGLPTEKISAFIRMIENDNTTRERSSQTASVYEDHKDKLGYSVGTYSRGATGHGFKLGLFVDLNQKTSVKDAFYEIKNIQFRGIGRIVKDGATQGLLRNGHFNWRTEQPQIKLGVTSSGSFKALCRSVFQTSFSSRLLYNLKVIADQTEIHPFNQGLMKSAKENVSLKDGFYINKSSTLGFNLKVTQENMVQYIKSKYNTYNNRKDVSKFKMGSINYLTSVVGKGRQSFYNPITPYDIDSHDLIYTISLTDIDVVSTINKVRILCLGDSITAGAPQFDPFYGSTVWMNDLVSGKVTTRNNKESSYPYWLQTRLGLDDFEIINEGSGRRTTPELLYHVDDQLETYSPQFVVICIGTNDIFAAQDNGVEALNNTVNTALFNIRQTVDKVINAGATPILGTQLPRNSIVPPEAKNALRQLNSGIRNLGIEKSIDIIDWYEIFVQHNGFSWDNSGYHDGTGGENGVLRYDLTVDDTHPSVTGYKTMAYSINLGIFNSFRATFRLFDKKNLATGDVDFDSEATKFQPDPYTLTYTMNLPDMRRLQSYVFSKYIKNTGNSWGMFIMTLDDPKELVQVWDEKSKTWTRTLIGQIAPDQVYELKMRFTMPATGRQEQIGFVMDYLVRR